ncbi:MAG: hypothetical protein NVSMB9_08240 [Isosphaeraceae bacterium]
MGVLTFGTWPSAASAQEIFCRNLGIYYQLVPYGQAYGARLTRNPLPKSPAAQLTLEVNDMIIFLDNQTIGEPEDLEKHIARTDVTFVNIRTNQPETQSVNVPHWVALDRLSRSAVDDIRKGLIKYEKPYIQVNGDTLAWNFDFVMDPSLFMDWSDPDLFFQVPAENRPVQAELVVQALRITQSQQQAFWEPYLKRVEKVIAEELAYLALSSKPDMAVFDKFDQNIREIYSQAMQSYAARMRLKAQYQPTPRLRQPYDVVISNPNGFMIGLLPLTKYEVALALNPTARTQNLSWKSYDSGSRVKLLGNYMYVLFNGPRVPPSTDPAKMSVENDGLKVLR